MDRTSNEIDGLDGLEIHLDADPGLVIRVNPSPCPRTTSCVGRCTTSLVGLRRRSRCHVGSGTEVHSVAEPAAGSVDGEDFAVVEEAVEDGGGEDGVAEEGATFSRELDLQEFDVTGFVGRAGTLATPPNGSRSTTVLTPGRPRDDRGSTGPRTAHCVPGTAGGIPGGCQGWGGLVTRASATGLTTGEIPGDGRRAGLTTRAIGRFGDDPVTDLHDHRINEDHRIYRAVSSERSES